MEAEFNVKDFENDQDTKGVYARFYTVPVQDQTASAEQGRVVFKDREYIEIVAAGNSNNIIRRPVSDMDRGRFRQAYAKFKEGDTEQLIGTPLTEVPWVSRSQCEELAYIKVRTLEQLAQVNDAACSSAPGMYELKRKAQAWLKKSEDAAPFTALAKENADLNDKIAVLEQTVKELAAAHNAAVAKK